MAHPLRMRILMVLDRRVASPNELAKELSEPLGNVSYHVRTLADYGLVKLVRKRPRRGAIEHFYKAEARPMIAGDAWERLPRVVKHQSVQAVLAQIAGDMSTAAEEGAFDHPDMALMRSRLVLDEAAWKKLSEEMGRVTRLAAELEEESRKRLATADGQRAMTATLVQILFEATSDNGNARPPRSGGRRKRAATGGAKR